MPDMQCRSADIGSISMFHISDAYIDCLAYNDYIHMSDEYIDCLCVFQSSSSQYWFIISNQCTKGALRVHKKK